MSHTGFCASTRSGFACMLIHPSFVQLHEVIFVHRIEESGREKKHIFLDPHFGNARASRNTTQEDLQESGEAIGPVQVSPLAFVIPKRKRQVR